MAVQTLTFNVADYRSGLFGEPLFKIELEIDSVQNIENNTSDITIKTYKTNLTNETITLIEPRGVDEYSWVNPKEAFYYTWGYQPSTKTYAMTEHFEKADVDMSDDSLSYRPGVRVFLGEVVYEEEKHAIDGTLSITFDMVGSGYNDTSLYGLPRYYGSSDTDSITSLRLSAESKTVVLPKIPPMAKILTATSFTDEENPKITYKNPTGNSVTSLQACIANSTGTVIYVPYRDISKIGSEYTFTLTDEERNTLRAAAANSKTLNVKFYVKTVISGSSYYNFMQRTLTITNCNPTITNIKIQDANSTTAGLTGDVNKLVRYESMAEYSFTPEAKKSATIATQYVQNGSKKVSGMNQGVIDDVESNTFTIGVVDSRGLKEEVTVTKPLVEYIKPTCNQKVEMAMSGETGAQATVTISGNYFNNTFGAVANTLKIELRHTQNDGTMGEWVDLTDGLVPVFNGNTYSLNITISGFDYNQSYSFMSRVTDKLNTVISAEYTARLQPIFDWSENDFNFNVPVNVNGTHIKMLGDTVLRHFETNENTVLAASGGHIYFRPLMYDDTSTEMRLTAQGNLELKGDLFVNGVKATTDFISSTGTSTVDGTTWRWRKWNSGIAECWGKKDFGTMDFDDLTGAVYLGMPNGASIPQFKFPTSLFNAAPTVINMNIEQGEFTGGIYRLGGAPTKTTSVKFLLYTFEDGTNTTNVVSCHAIGTWK